MPIKNFTTTIAAATTVGEIHALLGRRGAAAIQTEYAGGEPSAISFAIDINGRRLGYRLPCRPEGVLAALKHDRVERRHQTPEHARRVGWRIARDWLLAQFALIDAGGADLPEVFLPYLLVAPSETAYDRFLAGAEVGRFLLPAETE